MLPVNMMYGPDLHFRYDKKRRLTDALQTAPGGSFVYSWSRYSYPSARVIVDSIYEYQGSVNDPNPPNLPGLTIRIVRMQLDIIGRPVELLTYYAYGGIPADSFAIAYDRNGNQVTPGVRYDDKINIYQTSKTWQLYFLDFSRNNRRFPLTDADPNTPHSPAAYNAYGLPTKFLASSSAIFSFAFETMDVAYACDVPKVGLGY